jgi:hypothetical protein
MIFIVQESYLDPQFLRIVKYAKSGQATLKGLLSFPDLKAHNGKKHAFLKIITRLVGWRSLLKHFAEGVDGIYHESWFTRLPSVVKTLKIYSEAWGKKYCLSFQNTFQRFTVKYQIFYHLLIFRPPPPPPPHLDPLIWNRNYMGLWIQLKTGRLQEYIDAVMPSLKGLKPGDYRRLFPGDKSPGISPRG